MAKILVVEDMPDSAELAVQILRRYGHEVVIAGSSELGLQMAIENKPDLKGTCPSSPAPPHRWQPCSPALARRASVA